MPAKTKKTAASAYAVNEAFEKSDAWTRESGEKLREAATRVTRDLNAAGSMAIEGEIQHSTKFFNLLGSMANARTAATLSLLQAKSLQEAFDIEQNYARDAFESLSAGARELGEVRMNSCKEAAETLAATAKDIVQDLSKVKAA